MTAGDIGEGRSRPCGCGEACSRLYPRDLQSLDAMGTCRSCSARWRRSKLLSGAQDDESCRYSVFSRTTTRRVIKKTEYRLDSFSTSFSSRLPRGWIGSHDVELFSSSTS